MVYERSILYDQRRPPFSGNIPIAAVVKTVDGMRITGQFRFASRETRIAEGSCDFSLRATSLNRV